MTITVEAVTGSKTSLSTTEWSLNNGSSDHRDQHHGAASMRRCWI